MLKIDIWSTRIASWSQVGMLVVVTFGYFYTVRPLFQHQLLQEESAKLRIEKQDIVVEYESALKNKKKVENELNNIKSDLTKITIERDNMEASYIEAKNKQAKAEIKASNIELQISSNLKVLRKAQWEILLLDFTIAKYSANKTDIWDMRNNAEVGNDIIDAYKNSWSNPYKELIATVNHLEESNKTKNEFPAAYISELRGYITANKDRLVCENINFDTIKESYKKDKDNLATVAEKKVDEYVEKIRSENIGVFTWLGDYRERQTEVTLSDEGFLLKQRYRKRLQKLEDECKNKSRVLMDEFRKAKGATR